MMGPTQLLAEILSLAEIRDNGQLSDLLQLHANECRQAGLPSYREHWDAISTLEVKEITRAVEQLFGLTATEAEPIVRSVLNQHPRTYVALDLIEHFRPRPSRVPTPEQDAEWNAVTGGPAVEQWDDEQRRIALARSNQSATSKAKYRAW
jgi:hypothetical protein